MNEALPINPPSIAKSSSLPRAIWGIIAAFFLVSTMVQFIVLLDFGPDEPWHMDYVYTIAQEGRLPRPQENHIVQHPPLYYAAMAVIWKACGATQKPLSLPLGITSFDKFEPRAILARRLIRLVSTLLGCLTLFFIARTLALVGVSQAWQIFLVAWAAAWPMLQYVSALANNESLAYAYSAWFCYLLVMRWNEGAITVRQAFLLGLAAGAGALVKQNTLFVVPIALWLLWTLAPPGSKARCVGRFGVGFLLTSLWWPLHNVLMSGTIFTPMTRPPNQPTPAVVLGNWQKIGIEWGRALLESAFLPDWSIMFVPRAFETATMVGGAGAMAFLFAWGFRQRANMALWRLRAMSFVAILLLFFSILQYAAFQDQRAQFGGRYLLNALPWAMVFIAASLPVVTRRKDESKIAPPGLVALILLGFLLLIDASWWFIAWTHYQTSIATELQRRLAG